MVKKVSFPKVDEVFGIPIYFDAGLGLFKATVGSHEYQEERLIDLKRTLEYNKNIQLDEPVIFAGGFEMVLTNIVEITSRGTLVSGIRRGVGVSPNPEENEVYPRTEENMKIFNESEALRREGWKLIKQSEQMYTKLKPFPKNYWKNKMRAGMMPA